MARVDWGLGNEEWDGVGDGRDGRDGRCGGMRIKNAGESGAEGERRRGESAGEGEGKEAA